MNGEEFFEFLRNKRTGPSRARVLNKVREHERNYGNHIHGVVDVRMGIEMGPLRIPQTFGEWDAENCGGFKSFGSALYEIYVAGVISESDFI